MSTVESLVEPMADFEDYLLTSDLYMRLGELGVRGDKAPFFLRDGRLVDKEVFAEDEAYRPYRIGRERFERMVAADFLAGDRAVFLWEGRLVRQMKAGHTHFITVALLYQTVLAMLAPGWTAIQEQPVAIDESSLPEPDLAIIRGSLRDYLQRRPNALDLGLLIEVADSSLPQARRGKLRVYAQARLPHYWIVNIPERRVEAYESPINRPEGPGFAIRRDYGQGQEVPVILDGRQVGTIAVDEILPA